MIAPLLTGGGQEMTGAQGTENVPAIAAMAKSLRLLWPMKRITWLVSVVRKRIYDHVSQKPKVTMFSQLTPDFAPQCCVSRLPVSVAKPLSMPSRQRHLHFDNQCLLQ